ncbi:MAG: prepilin-type N-terminal cleavage/methylation domain-containing protein [Capsulimonadales bacterium]|nr:prepilin-type N-terminal cleavage/methylation domain-containing protein [Capsulimonadales bacterium]
MECIRSAVGRYRAIGALSPSARAFTLVELLVVIAIIALLAAIIFPVFAQVRGKARQTVCLSNLKQIGLGVQMYTQDYDGLLPFGKDASDTFVPEMWAFAPEECRAYIDAMPMLHPVPEKTAALMTRPAFYRTGILDPYLKSWDIWKCAGDTGFDTLDNNSSCNGPCAMPARPTMFEKYGASYLVRTALAIGRANIDTLEGVDFNGQPAGPAQINLLFDGAGSWHGNASFFTNSGLKYVTLFVDGHAKLLTNQQYQEAWAVRITGQGSGPCP